MNTQTCETVAKSPSAALTTNFHFYDHHPETGDYIKDVVEGLIGRQKKLPCHLLYDEIGSALFEKICETEEYYVTRTETELLKKYAPDIARFIGPDAAIFEFGSGNTRKVRVLLDQLKGRCAYLALDISKDQLFKNAGELALDYPHLKVVAVCADFQREEGLPLEIERHSNKVFFFPGSTIGNLAPEEASQLLRKISRMVGSQGAALVGVDLKKDPELLDLAYNDEAGFTSKFEMHALERLNDEFGANFDLKNFHYWGSYNPSKGKVEMFLVSREAQTATLQGNTLRFRKGERIHIEDSHKYSIEEFQQLARSSGFKTAVTWIDRKNWFSIHLLLR